MLLVVHLFSLSTWSKVSRKMSRGETGRWAQDARASCDFRIRPHWYLSIKQETHVNQTGTCQSNKYTCQSNRNTRQSSRNTCQSTRNLCETGGGRVSVQGVSVQEGRSLSRVGFSVRENPRTVTCGQYASYWNALFFSVRLRHYLYRKPRKFSEIMVFCGVYLFSWARRRVCLCVRRRVHSLRQSTPHRAPSLSAPDTCSVRYRKKRFTRLYSHQSKSNAKPMSVKHVLILEIS